jgi:hypothetical protein
MVSACNHQRTELLVRQGGVEYVHCLDCDEVYEADDLEPVAVFDEE